MNYGTSYQFRITSLNGKKPTFVCGNGSVFQVDSNGQQGNNYYFKVKAVGNPGQTAGFYVNGIKTPSTVGKITGTKSTFISDTGLSLDINADE